MIQSKHKGADTMKIFHEPSYDRFRLLDVEKTNENLKSMKEVQPYRAEGQGGTYFTGKGNREKITEGDVRR